MLKDLFPNSENIIGTDYSNEVKKVRVICPVCKCNKEIKVPKSIINQSIKLTNISIPKGLICNHHFQAFVDKQFKVRGYQKVDLELKPEKIEDQKDTKKEDAGLKKEDNFFFENLILEGNFIEYKPKKIKEYKKNSGNVEDLSIEKKEMTLEEIYEEFWEFIEDDNHEFREIILKDKRRREALKNNL